MKSNFILALFYLILSFEANGQANNLNIALGKYFSYKWYDLPTTDMTYHEADSYKGKKMIINQNSFILFSDTLKDIKYELRKCDQTEFFREFRHFDHKKMKIGRDTLEIMTVVSPSYNFHPPIDIIITEEFLVTNFNGYFYFFKKGSKNHGTIKSD